MSVPTHIRKHYIFFPISKFFRPAYTLQNLEFSWKVHFNYADASALTSTRKSQKYNCRFQIESFGPALTSAIVSRINQKRLIRPLSILHPRGRTSGSTCKSYTPTLEPPSPLAQHPPTAEPCRVPPACSLPRGTLPGPPPLS